MSAPSHFQLLEHLLLRMPALVVVLLAWVALGASAVVESVRLARLHRTEAAAAAGLFVAALALRFAVPHGPLDFTEAQRLPFLWDRLPRPIFGMESLPLSASVLLALGVPPALFERAAGPVAGALGVALLYLLARAGGLRRSTALVAGLGLLLWPAHVRYSASTGFTVPAATLATGVFLVAAADALRPAWRTVLLASCTIVTVWSRPEYRFLLPALLPLVLSPGWSGRERVTLAALLAVGLVPYLPGLAPPTDVSTYPSWNIAADHLKTLFAPSTAPIWWCATGVAGLVAGVCAPRLRLSAALLAGLLFLAYTTARETNPLFGVWRYLLSLLPALLLGTAALAEKAIQRLGEPRARTVAAVALAAVAVSGLLHVSLWWRAVDLQEQHAYLRASAPAVLAQYPQVVLANSVPLSGERVDGLSEMQLLGMSLGTGLRLQDAKACEPGIGSVRVWPLGVLLGDCPVAVDAGHTVLFLGLHRPPALMQRLAARYRLVPLDEKVRHAACTAPWHDTQCNLPADGEGSPQEFVPVGTALPDVPLVLGWYRLEPEGS